MSTRTNFVLFVVAALLTAYAWIFEAGSASWTQRGLAFPDLNPNEIVELRISRPGIQKDAGLGIETRAVALRKEGTPPIWWLVEPIRFVAFHPKVQSLCYDLAELLRVAEAPASGGQDPFTGDVVVLSFKTRDGARHEIEVGAEHSDAKLDFVYVRETSPGSVPFVTRREFRKDLLVSLNELRSRTLFGIAPEDAVRLEVSGEAKFAKVLARDEASDRWRIKEPIEAAADRELVDNLLRELNSWTITSFYKDSAAESDLAACGLDHPIASIRMQRRDGYSISVEVGSKVEKVGDPKTSEIYVRPAAAPFVFRAAGEPLSLLLQGYEEYRSRFLLDLGIEDVEEIVYESQAAHNILRRVKEADGHGYAWQVLDANGAVLFPGDEKDIEAEVIWHRSLTIQKFLSQPLVTVKRKVTFKTSGKRILELALGDLSMEKEHRGQNMYAASLTGEQGSCLVSTRLPGKFESGPIAFRQKNISTLDPARAHEIRVLDGERQWSLARALPGDPWMLNVDTPPVQDKELSSSTIDKFLLQLHKDGFRVERYVPDATDFIKLKLELESPRRGVILDRLDGDDPVAFHKLVIGEKYGEQGETLGRVDIPGLPPFILERDVEEYFAAMVKHLREVTGQ